MPSLKINELETILKYFNKNIKDYTNFIETGTYVAETTTRMAEIFQNVYTIELSKELFNLSFDRCKHFNNIQCFFGDSTHILPIICESLEEPTIFWLDAHWSCQNTTFGDKQVPLLEELESIRDKFKYSGLLIIDDFRLFRDNNNYDEVDWSEITIENVLKSIRNYKEYCIFGDRFVILI